MSIEVILGSMFSEKSTELIKRVRRHLIAGRTCLVFKNGLDCDRYNTRQIITHDKKTLEAMPVTTILEIKKYIYGRDFDVIAIDEAQFFDEDIVDFSRAISQNFNKKVILAGLDMDYCGNPFGYMGDLCCIADTVTKLHAVCMKCGQDAKYSHRKSNEKNVISIGAIDKYEALCEKCYIEGDNEKWRF